MAIVWTALPRPCMRFDEIGPGLRLSGIVPGEAVDILHVQPVGDDARLVTYRETSGGLAERVVLRSEAEALVPAEASRAWALTADGELFKTGMEAHRIRLAHLFDPMMAVHTSDVIPLPHQITAVYEAMLPRQPLRFILATAPRTGRPVR